MSLKRTFDVAIVGGGPAGITAAAALGRKGYSTIVLEAGVYPGAENWSGTVYFGENLVHDDAFGPDLFEDAPYERNLVQRGFSLYDGVSMFGGSYRDDSTFRHCYTVLRPVFDRYLAERVKEWGVTVLPETTVQSLIREEGRVIGCQTERGPVYADCVFLAEGDASHLTTQEGYERVEDERPEFLQGIKEVIELSPEVIEKRFDVGPGEGSASEVLVRNGNIGGSTARLNMGAFLYTNRDSLSIGLVLPLHNLKTEFSGDHNDLMEWFKGLPEIQKRIEGGEVTSFGTKIIRGGGYREIPQIVDDGLAIGGAATGIGLDFPYPNFTGPATKMGLLFAQAYDRIRTDGNEPGKLVLEDEYLQPLQETHYYQNVQYLQGFPSYVEKTKVFFENQIDLVAGTARIATSSDTSSFEKLRIWVRHVRDLLTGGEWTELIRDRKQLSSIFGLPEHIRANLDGRVLLDGILNSFQALLPGTPVPERHPGRLELFYRSSDHEVSSGDVPLYFRWMARRMNEPLKGALRHVYTNDDTPIETKIRRAVRSVMRGTSFLDLMMAVPFLLLTALLMASETLRDLIQFNVLNRDVSEYLNRPEQTYKRKRREEGTMDEERDSGAMSKEQKLSTISYLDTERSNIKVFWPEEIQNRKELESSPLWSVCPARVYEVHTQFLGNPGVVVNYENCIKCETCWRATEDVHWSRATEHRMVYETYTPSHVDLVTYLNNRSAPRPQLPAPADPDASWEEEQTRLIESIEEELSIPDRKKIRDGLRTVPPALERLRIRLAHFPESLEDAPPVLEKSRIRWIEQYVSSIERIVDEIDLVLRGQPLLKVRRDMERSRDRTLYTPWKELQEQIEEMRTAVDEQKLFWASLIGDKILDHHLPRFRTAIRPLFDTMEVERDNRTLPDPLRELDVETPPGYAPACDGFRFRVREMFEDAFDHQAIKAIERGESLSEDQREVLANAIRDLPLTNDPHDRRTRVLVEEGARVDPALAWLVGHHLWALRILDRSGCPERKLESYRTVKRWLSVCVPTASDESRVEVSRDDDPAVTGHVEFVPCALADAFLVVDDGRVALCPRDRNDVTVKHEDPSGMKGARIARVQFDGTPPRDLHPVYEHSSRPTWLELLDDVRPFYVDLARGGSEYLLGRARDHAESRVQFPGQFQDEAGHDTIAKFGAVKEMLAEMETNRYLLETVSILDPSTLCPEDESVASAAKRYLAGHFFGPDPGSFGYNTGQIFGGTAFSEDDFIAKYYRDSAVTRFLVRHPDSLLEWIGRRVMDEPDLIQNHAALYETFEREASAEPLLEDAWRPFTDVQSRLHDFVLSLKNQPKQKRTAPVLTHLGEITAGLLALRGALLRTFLLAERGDNPEREVVACRKEATDLMDDLHRAEEVFDRHEQTVKTGDHLLEHGPFEPVPSLDLPYSYGSFLDSDQQHRSGQSLLKAYRPETPSYLPEMVVNDEEIEAWAGPLIEEIRSKYYTLDGYPEGSFGDGLCFPRYLEEIHTLPEDDLQYLLESGYLRVPIDPEDGGEGYRKSFYYLMCDAFMRFADPAMALCIMVNTSIGTTPIQLGLKQDLPRARKALSDLEEDSASLTEIAERIDDLLRQLENPDVKELTESFTACEELVRERIRESGVLKYLSGGFLHAFYDAAQAGQEKDLDGFERHLKTARKRFEQIEESISEQIREYDVREQAHHRHLKMISAGWISAFALTEPTAGSDSGGIKTQAKRKKTDLRPLEDGRFAFVPDGEERERYLIDATRLEFDYDERETFYRYSEEDEPAKLHFDEYDYEKDRPEGKKRYYVVDGEKRYVHDLGRVRQDGNEPPYYEFFELNGAKMWITNGRFAHMFCLYARTEEEGVTGFVVDRHAEGLVVGQDEEKMGQKGSPTNELSLKDVRVPRENVIGVKGRGQVNALEALNAGRTGLAYGSVGIMKDIVERGTHYLQTDSGAPDRASDRVRHLFGRLAEHIVSTESLAFDLVGYVDHPETDGIRMESAVGKYYASERVHDAIRQGERLRGVTGQTARHDIEKKRRDARVITIYEGTNEVQRFLLLKDLVQNIYEDRKLLEDAEPSTSGHPDLLQRIQSCRETLFEYLQESVERFDQQVWQQVTYQPVFFPLSEMAGLIKLMYVTLQRLDVIGSRSDTEGQTGYGPLLDSASRLFIRRAENEFRILSDRFERRFDDLCDNMYPPEVQLGFQSLEQRDDGNTGYHGEPEEIRVEDELHLAVMLKPVPMTAPEPRLHDGELIEPLQRINPADRSALDQALRIKQADPEQVHVTVLSVSREGSAGVEPILRKGLALGADHAVRIDVDRRDVPPSLVAGALGDTFESRTPSPDLILLGSRATDTEQGTVPPMLAGQLDHLHLDGVSRFTSLTATEGILTWKVGGESWNGNEYTGEGTAVLAFHERKENVGAFSVSSFLDAQSHDVERVQYRATSDPDLRIQYRHRQLGEASSTDKKATDPVSAARTILERTGSTGDEVADGAPPYDGDIRDLSGGDSLSEEAGWGLYLAAPQLEDTLDGESLHMLEAGRELATVRDVSFNVFLPADRPEDELRTVFGQVAAVGGDRIFLYRHPEIQSFSWIGYTRLLKALTDQIGTVPSLWMGEDRYRDVICRLGSIRGGDRRTAAPEHAAHWFSTRHLHAENGTIELSTPVLQESVDAVATVPRDVSPLGVTFHPDVTVPETGGRSSSGSDTPPVFRFSPDLSYEPADDPVSKLMTHRFQNGAADALEDARVIVDVGYGVGDAEGMRSLTEPLTTLLEEELNLDGVMVGATRKVTQDLELLPADRQIGQTGVRVNPDLLLALGVSGAPQHVDYIGENATIFSFNVDADAPLMNLNEDRPAPVVHPIPGDMFETVPAFIEAVRAEQS